MSSAPLVPSGEEKATGRTEAFSDGVMAIAITLLAFQIAAPTIEHAREVGGLGQALTENGWTYFAYVTSWLVILIMWVNHHRLFSLLRGVDHSAQMLNGVLLMLIALVPFATALVSSFLSDPDDGRVACFVYTTLMLLIALVFRAFWGYVAGKRRLIRASVPDAVVAAVYRQYRFGPVIYILAMIVALIIPFLSVLMIGLIALWFALPSRKEEVVHVS